MKFKEKWFFPPNSITTLKCNFYLFEIHFMNIVMGKIFLLQQKKGEKNVKEFAKMFDSTPKINVPSYNNTCAIFSVFKVIQMFPLRLGYTSVSPFEGSAKNYCSWPLEGGCKCFPPKENSRRKN